MSSAEIGVSRPKASAIWMSEGLASAGLCAADRGENLDIARVLAADPADDQRGRCPGRPQRPELCRQPGRVIAGHDLVVRAVAPGQFVVYPLEDGAVAAHDHDGGRAGGSAC